ncbi:MAG: hypothetical protein A2233_05545 [Candidatus Kerfeldbacteria bacterium RIFOXYA2_FULL_38_24]|uniref:tetrahydrofolate synthase n=1 Tax=Candidatus Kerfeldbacteria bacterium RIFOXYB2_FULL_38_14 TaxID=1798547 RepID=A0A1G2BJ15_9BACT|nr:MAG: hypothetical protein A2233_05545 [Candidatus Kerfeldbacteria bacterium RIFOXYA2_FULL_38_24]OGY88290.1 MAG: hypothetical protein A2319_03830 [Candidatus Kerfeldbacteria bacterium RIFOXYB2_FULL_38_14]OGY89736.1 MAG: hypothetical protein A2458_01600 [Candidatus Kerfeldbacteria bacterium RIFOXYC2_FULL_38_9]
MIFSDYKKAVRRLEKTIQPLKKSYMDSTVQKNGKFFLERTQRLMAKLKNPEKNFNYIHVAGTAGKGSTATMIYEVLHAARYNVGLHTSPHVSTTLERMQVRGKLINPQSFIWAVNKVLPLVERLKHNDPWRPSYSEIAFAVALIAFKKEHCQWLVIETSCGGRYDLTNIIPAPLICILTNVSLDHTEVLGKTVTAIAWHKAGIIKKNSVIFSAETKPSVRKIFNKEAKKFHQKIHYAQPAKNFTLIMPGAHQQNNAALAEAAAKHLKIKPAMIKKGLQKARLPARIEILQKKPLIILDGAHDLAKILALTKTLKQFKPWGKFYLIFAAKKGKKVTELLAPLAKLVDTAYLTSFQLPGFGSIPSSQVGRVLHKINPAIKIILEPVATKALSACLKNCRQKNADKNPLILITGSLYLCGKLRQSFILEQGIVEKRNCFPV